jgi:sodium transport system ATP-binding protein
MIEVQHLSKRFKLTSQQKKEMGRDAPPHVDAAVDVTFRCRPGRVYTLLGPNGAGKTTTLRIIATMLRPTQGTVSVCGHDVVQAPREVRRRLGFLTGSTGLYDRLTPEEIVRYYATLHGMDPIAYRKRRDGLFARLGIHEFARRRIGKLSSGMKQKVSIARTMIHDPDVVVFDEPTAGLDVVTARSVIELIRGCRDGGKTVIFSTHIMGEVSLLSDDLGIIDRGRLIYGGTYDGFRSQMKSPSLEDEFIRVVGEAHP